jgi:hypothetical protein
MRFLRNDRHCNRIPASGTWLGPSPNILPRTREICGAQTLPGDRNRFAIHRLGLCASSAHGVTAGVAMPCPFHSFLDQHTLGLYVDRAGDVDGEKRQPQSASKTRYTCPACELNAWAKPDANLVCGDCQETMEAEEPE